MDKKITRIAVRSILLLMIIVLAIAVIYSAILAFPDVVFLQMDFSGFSKDYTKIHYGLRITGYGSYPGLVGAKISFGMIHLPNNDVCLDKLFIASDGVVPPDSSNKYINT